MMNSTETIQAHCAEQLEQITALTKSKKQEVDALLKGNQKVLNEHQPFEEASKISKHVDAMLNDVDKTLTQAMSALSEQLGVPTTQEDNQTE